MDRQHDDADDFVELDLQEPRNFLKDYPVVQVYLASPLTGLKPDQQETLCSARRLVRQVLESCRTHQFRVYDPADHTAPGTPHPDSEVYAIDHQHVGEADVVFFFVTGPSTGMGMEAQIAAEATVPRVVIRDSRIKPTRMFLGAPSRTLATITFTTVEDIAPQLEIVMCQIGDEAAKSRGLRANALEGFPGFGKFFLKRRIQAQVTLEELSMKTDTTASWLRRIESREVASALASGPLLARMADLLDIELVADGSRISLAQQPTRQPLTPVASASLDALADFVISKEQVDDRRVLEIWRSYVDERAMIEAEAIAGREDLIQPLGINDWKARYDQRKLF